MWCTGHVMRIRGRHNSHLGSLKFTVRDFRKIANFGRISLLIVEMFLSINKSFLVETIAIRGEREGCHVTILCGGK